MTPRLHPHAAASYDAGARDLLKYLEPIRERAKSLPEFPSELVPAATVTSANAHEVRHLGETTYNGDFLSRCFTVGDQELAFRGDGYRAFKHLAERIATSKELRRSVSSRYVEDRLVDWAQEMLGSTNAGDTFSVSLESRLSEDVLELTTWVPVADLEIQAALRIGEVNFLPITSGTVDGWMAPHMQEGHGRTLDQDLRRRLQGRAACVMEQVAERQHAFDTAIRTAQRATSFLAIFSPGARRARARCTSTVLGSELHRKGTVLIVRDGALTFTESRILESSLTPPWRITREQIQEFNQLGLTAISTMLQTAKRTDFEEAVLSSALLYSRAAFAAAPFEKLVHALSALESILLKDQSEPIQQNLGERIAFAISTDATERQQIVADLKGAYRLRSRYLHHGRESLDEVAQIDTFLNIAWTFFVKLLSNANGYSTKEDFLGAIDQVKFS